MAATGAGYCFHCGEPAPAGSRFSAVIDGAPRTMCCAGCAAVAQTIADSGLAAYYGKLSALPQREFVPQARSVDLSVYDIPDVQRPFVRGAEGTLRQATLLVEGVGCGACAWLIERALRRLPGVRDAAVNLAARRVQVDWEDGRIRLSRILETLAALGYRAQGFDAAASDATAMRERRAMLWRLFVAGFAMMQVMMYLVPVYIAGGDMTREAEQLMRWASFTLTVPVMLWSAGPFFANAWRDARAHRFGMDAPVALGITVAFAASAWATLTGRGEVYFDSITMFVFLLLGARYLEARARARAAESQQRMLRRVPAVAERLVPGAAHGVTERVAVARLVPGDLVLVAPGSTVPADGKVTAGRSAADESLLTGEARPVAKGAGDTVIGGSVNLASPLTVEVTRVGPETVLAGIIRLMDHAQAGKPLVAQLADRVAQWFVAALIVVALATAGVWYVIDPQRALWVMVAVLVVSCPCALSVATPAALAAATDALQRLGILIVRGHALETLSGVTHVVFDKTGTLTLGHLSLVGTVPLGAQTGEACLALAAALERGSEHPIARAMLTGAASLSAASVTGLRNHPGRGIEARINGDRVRIGSPAFVSESSSQPLPAELGLVADDTTAVLLGDERGYLALFTFADAVRPGAASLARELTDRGMTVCLLSGDRRATVMHVARELGMAVIAGEAGPEAKLEFVQDLQARGARVAMVGDGINDAPVLARAQVSIVMGGGTDLAHASADLVLVGDDLCRLPAAFDIARATMRVIRQNLAWAVAYNAVAIPLAVGGLVTPLLAGAGMAVSSLVVVLNALRLQAAHLPDRQAAVVRRHGQPAAATP